MQAQTSVTEEKGVGLMTVLTAMAGNTYVLDSGSFGMESWLSHFSAVGLWKHGSTSRSFVRPLEASISSFQIAGIGFFFFFCNGPEGKYFGLCGPYSLGHNDPSLPW